MDNLNLNDFNYFIDLFSSKFGKPIDKTFISPFEEFSKSGKDYRRFRFLKNGISVEIEYDSAHSDEIGDHPNQISIYYTEYTSEKYTTYAENRKSHMKFKQEQKDLQKKGRIAA